MKHTPSSHPDQMPLQMALTKLEGIAEHLNEAKRQREQTTIVHYLNSRISGLPFVSVSPFQKCHFYFNLFLFTLQKLIDSQRRLLRQDIVTRLVSIIIHSDNGGINLLSLQMLKDSRVLRKQRTLLLFSNMVLCASVRYKKKNPTSSFQ